MSVPGHRHHKHTAFSVFIQKVLLGWHAQTTKPCVKDRVGFRGKAVRGRCEGSLLSADILVPLLKFLAR